MFTVTDRARVDAAIAVRLPVFVDEQRVPVEEEIDEHDRSDLDARHALLRDEHGIAVATGRYYRLENDTAQIGRMAVLAPHRGAGLGRRVLDALIADARSRGFRRANLHAQLHAVGFYERAGFASVGPTFLDCDIPHQAMERTL